jgi:chromosome segregation ATPase
MSLDELPQQFEQFVERARAALGQEITAAKNIVAAANAEKSSAQSTLADLQTQIKSAQDQLKATLANLDRASTLAGLNREIAAARKTLAAVQADTEAATKALEKLAKQRDDGQNQVVTLGNQLSRVRQERAEHEAVIADIRAKLAQVQIGHRP